MAKKAKKSSSSSGWVVKSVGEGAPQAGKSLPGKRGEAIGRSTPPWPISEFPPFRNSDGGRTIREDKGKPYQE